MKSIQKMKALILVAMMVSSALIFSGCSKEPVVTKTPEEVLYDYLTSEFGNKKWFLQKIYVNGVEQALTDSQKKYYKTYTRTATPLIATFLDDDGNRGKAYLISRLALKEIIENAPAGPTPREYIILDLKEKLLDLQVTGNGSGQNQSVREVYYAN